MIDFEHIFRSKGGLITDGVYSSVLVGNWMGWMDGWLSLLDVVLSAGM